MKVKKIREGVYSVRVEELLPCSRFKCTHELSSCAIEVWCPEGCYNTNRYVVACLPKCNDCIYYPDRCKNWREFSDKHNHRANTV